MHLSTDTVRFVLLIWGLIGMLVIVLFGPVIIDAADNPSRKQWALLALVFGPLGWAAVIVAPLIWGWRALWKALA